MSKCHTTLARNGPSIPWRTVIDALWDGRYAVLSGFIGYIDGTAHPETDEELFSMMKILSGDFIAQLDEEMHFRRLWRQ